MSTRSLTNYIDGSDKTIFLLDKSFSSLPLPNELRAMFEDTVVIELIVDNAVRPSVSLTEMTLQKRRLHCQKLKRRKREHSTGVVSLSEARQSLQLDTPPGAQSPVRRKPARQDRWGKAVKNTTKSYQDVFTPQPSPPKQLDAAPILRRRIQSPMKHSTSFGSLDLDASSKDALCPPIRLTSPIKLDLVSMSGEKLDMSRMQESADILSQALGELKMDDSVTSFEDMIFLDESSSSLQVPQLSTWLDKSNCIID
jgi:hypothetical protein